jgi:hypothetical protein
MTNYEIIINFIEKNFKVNDCSFLLTYAQKTFIRDCELRNKTLTIKPRCIGLTTVMAAYCAAKCFLNQNNDYKMLFVTTDNQNKQIVCGLIGGFLKQIPLDRWYEKLYNEEGIYYNNGFGGGHTSFSVGKNILSVVSMFDKSISYNTDVNLCFFDETLCTDKKGDDNYSVLTGQLYARNPNMKLNNVCTPKYKDSLLYVLYKDAIDHKNDYYVRQFDEFDSLISHKTRYESGLGNDELKGWFLDNPKKCGIMTKEMYSGLNKRINSHY